MRLRWHHTLRPLNRCSACNYTWHPKGKNVSLQCPKCGNTTVELATKSNVSDGSCFLICFVVVVIAGSVIMGLVGANLPVAPPPKPNLVEEKIRDRNEIKESENELPVQNEVEELTGNSSHLPAYPAENLIPAPVITSNALRTWTTADGKFSRDAEFQKAIADTVYLKKKDGSIVEMKKSQLSEGDLDWIKQRAKK